jgi:hypothetical protein
MNGSSDGISDEDDTIMNSSDSDFEGAVKSVLQSEISWQWKAAMFASMDASAHGGRNRDRAGNERWCHTLGVEQMDFLQDGTFKKMFRVDRHTFYDILERITPFM